MGLAGALTGGSFSASGAGASSGAAPRGGMAPRSSVAGRGEQWTQAGASQSQSAWDPMSTPYGPQLSQYPSQMQSLLGQWLFGQSQYAQQGQMLQQQNGLDLGRLGLQQAGLGTDNAGLGIDRRDLAAQLGFVGRQEGLADKLLGNTQAGFGIDEEIAKNAAAIDQRDINNRAAAGGAWFSPETRLDRKDVDTGLSQRMGQIKLAREGAKLGREGQQIGFDSTRSDLAFGLERIGLSQDRLDQMGQSLGLDRQELDLRLSEGLLQLGIDGTMFDMAMSGQMGELDQNQLALLQQAVEWALANGGGAGTTTAVGPMPASGGGGGGGGGSAPKYQ